MSFDTAKTLGLVGAVLSLLDAGFVGGIFLLISFYYLSRYYSEPTIFRSFLVAYAAALLAPVFALFGFLSLSPLLLLLAFLLGVLSIVFQYVTLSTLSSKSGVGLFRLSGLLVGLGLLVILIGLPLVIVLVGFLFLLVGGLLVFVGRVLLVISFAQLREPSASTAPPVPLQQPAVPA